MHAYDYLQQQAQFKSDTQYYELKRQVSLTQPLSVKVMHNSVYASYKPL